MLNRRDYFGRACALLVCAALAACAGESDTALIGSLLWQRLSGAPAQKISRDVATAIPYATMGLQLGSGPEVLLVLGTATTQQLDWYAGDQAVIVTQAGRVIRTVGLPYDLGGVRPLAGASMSTDKAGDARETVLLMDFPDLGAFGALVRCTRIDRGNETVDILGADIPVRHEVERCSAQTLDWNFQNDFWRDPQTGYVWRSSQHIHPKSPPVILEALRPEQNGPG